MPLVDGRLIGKYRRLLIPFTSLKQEAATLAPTLGALQAQVNTGPVPEAEITTGFIRIFAEHRTGKSWPQIPGMPGMIETILNDWLSGRVDLRLTESPVSAQEMLRAQAEGWRYVTVSFGHALAGEPIEGNRDAFEFALHDLGHAYAFFKPDYDLPGQVAFFGQLMADLETLAPFAQTDAKFSADLEYCMSDMNSHPEHLRQYLRGVIVELFLRRHWSEAELQALLEKLSCLQHMASVAGPA